MALSKLVSGDVKFADYWEERPILSRDLGDLDDVISLVMLEDVIIRRGIRKPFFRMLQDGAEIDEASYVRSIGEGASALSGMPDLRGIHSSLRAGATLVLQGLRLYVPTVARFCDELSDELGHPIHANAYLTPHKSRGAGAHYDYHSVFIRQVWGRKFWRVQEPVEHRPKDPCRDGAEFDTPVVLETWLEPGDCLYLPRGYVHDGWTEEEPSLHLTCSMLDPHTWASILARALYECALNRSEDLGSILPIRFADDPVALAALTREKLQLLSTVIRELSPDDIVTDVIQRYGPASWDFRPPQEFPGLLDAVAVSTGLPRP